jgi:thiamine-monophosphate kinase
MREFDFIAAIRRMLGPPRRPVLVGVGDDAAVLAGSRRAEVVTTDTQIEGIHFRREWQPARSVGARAAEITLSDLAAMGARPRALFAALHLPFSIRARDALAVMRGIASAAERHACPVAGGNVAGYHGPLALTLTAIGELPAGRKAFLRSGARPGDGIFVTGPPGLARIGLETLQRTRRPVPRALRPAVRKYLEPRARFEEIEFLAASVRIGAVIDLSDGLAGDLGHVLEESEVGAELEPSVPSSYREACVLLGLDPMACMLGPSDDYELLFTAAKPLTEKLMQAFRRRFRRELWRVGRITKKRGLWLRLPGGGLRVIEPRSYEHRFG